jgi:hypothetical protein
MEHRAGYNRPYAPSGRLKVGEEPDFDAVGVGDAGAAPGLGQDGRGKVFLPYPDRDMPDRRFIRTDPGKGSPLVTPDGSYPQEASDEQS